ncbi:MAG: hypothetical protein JNL80_17455 [Phycisphaerae bacterium]|jgi:hypothetical protein|nr:hypothetical protein [Phycisphaerae bacterium]
MPRRCRLIASALLALTTAASASDNLLVNAEFEIPGAFGPIVEHTGYTFLGESAADEWYVFHNTEGTTVTSLEPSTINPGGMMMRVKTTGTSNGIEQVLGAFDTGPACVKTGVWVYVESGAILTGAGNGGQTAADTFLTTTGEWVFVSAQNTLCPVNLFIIYAASPGGAIFYVDGAVVEKLDCIGPPGDFNQDGFVNAADLSILLGSWGVCRGCDADLNHDGVVAGADLAILLANWGC